MMNLQKQFNEVATIETQETMETMEMKVDFYNALFVNKESYYIESGQKVRQSNIVCMNDQYANYMKHLINQYRGKITAEEVVSETMWNAWNTIKGFKITDNKVTWEDMILANEKAHGQLSMLFAKMKQTNDPKLWEYVYDITQVTMNGETQYISEAIQSLEAPIGNVEEGAMYMDAIVKSLWTEEVEEEQTKESIFMNWFRNNRHNFLTAKQNAYIDSLQGVDVTQGFTSRDVSTQLDMDSANIDKMNKRIKEKTLEAYNDTEQVKMYHLLKEVYHTNTADEVAQWLKENINKVKNILKDKPYYSQLRKDLRAKLPKHENVLEAKLDLVDAYIEQDGLYDSKRPFYKKEHEKTGFDVNVAKERYMEAIQPSDVVIYKGNETITQTSDVKVELSSFDSKIKTLEYLI